MQPKPLALLIALALILGPGCSRDKKSEVYSTPQGKVTVTKQADGQQQVTVQGKDGTANITIGKQAAPADLGVPFYPGTKQEEGGSWSMKGGEKDGQAGSVTSAMLSSKDSVDKVLAFYKEKLADRKPEVYEMTMPTGKMANIIMEDGETTTTAIVLTEDRDQSVTRIQITKSAK